jgi:O-antigen/teichoic acid export membrane protein
LSKEFELGKTFARGTFYLLVGKIASRAVGIIGGLLLIRLLGPVDYGLLNVAAVAPGIFALLNDFGIGAALTKYLAEFRSTGKTDIKHMLRSGLTFKFILGSGLTLLCYFTSDIFAISIGKPHVAPLIKAASLLVLAWTLYGVSEAILIGLDAAGAYAYLMFIYEFLGAILPIILVIYGMGVFGALLGMAIATLIAGLVGIFVSFVITFKTTKEHSDEVSVSKIPLRRMLNYGVPLATSTFIRVAMKQYYGFMIATYAVEYDIGNYNAAKKLVSAIQYLTFPITTLLFPLFAKINPTKESMVLKKVFKYSVKYSSLLVLPAIVLLIVLANPLTTVVFGDEWKNAWIYLIFLAVVQLKYGSGGLHMGRLLMAQGETTFIAKLEALSAIIGIGLSFVMVPTFGIYGVILISLIVPWPSYLLMFQKVLKKFGAKPPFSDVGRIYLSAVITGLMLLLVSFMPFNELFKLIFGGLIGGIAFLVATPLTKAIKVDDVEALKEIAKSQPVINFIINKLFLKILKPLVKLF